MALFKLLGALRSPGVRRLRWTPLQRGRRVRLPPSSFSARTS